MANKERNKRSARQARQRDRAEREAQAVEAAAKSGSKTKVAVAAKKAPVKAASDKSTGLIGRARSYFSEVRAEMRRVTWPSRNELTNYSVAVVAMLIVFGVAVWAIDTGFVAVLVAFTGLRG